MQIDKLIKENIKFCEYIIKKQFKEALGYEINLENPKSFNEKLQWLKLYYHNPLMTKCADKYLAREYIKEKIGEEYLIPLIGVWDKVEDIDFNSLPKQFVLKVNWGSGQNIIVKDKSKLNIEETKNKLNGWLKPFSNHYYYSYEWQYKDIEPKIICEKYIEQMDGSLYDYRVFCFNGKPNFILVDMDASTFNEDGKYLRSIYTTEWEKLKNVTIYHKYYNGNIDKPIFLEEVLKISNKLSSNFIHLRVDFYIINNKPFVGELTFTHQNGIGKFMPQEYDYKFGELLELPKEKRIEYNFSDRETFIKQSCILEPVSFEYKRLERELSLKNKETISNNDYQKLRLNCNWWTLFGISNNSEYLRLTLFGIRISIKMNKEKVDKLAWFIPVKKWRENFRNKFFDNFIGGVNNSFKFLYPLNFGLNFN